MLPITKREWEVLAELANGLTVPEVAAKLGIHTQTVKNLASSAYKRLKVKGRYAAFLELGWLTPPEVD
jgi:DNA-binding NarL/FixJ family response regulator